MSDSSIEAEFLWASAENLGEPILDQLLDEKSFLRDIPVLSSALTISKAISGVSDRLLLHKALVMMGALTGHTTAAQRECFASSLRIDPERGRRVGVLLLSHVDRATSLDKAQMIGLIAAAACRREVSLTEFEELLHSVEACTPHDLSMAVDSMANLSAVALPSCLRLMSSGLVVQTMGIVLDRDNTKHGPNFEATPLLRTLARVTGSDSHGEGPAIVSSVPDSSVEG